MPGEAANDAAENARRTSFAEPVQTPVRATRRESGGGRRKSIQVTLESTGRKGKYILTADDPEIGDVLRHSIEDEMARAGAGGAKKPRNRFRDLVFTRQFTTFDRQNPTSYQSPFHGFFTLFWLAMALLLCRVAAQNWRTYGSVLGRNEIMHMMFDRDIVVLGLTDGVMTLSTAFGLLLQKLMAKNYLSWNRLGWIIQHVWQTFYLFSVLWWTWYREWPWTHTIFIVLHTMVFLMKQHSYAFYNGYLSQVLKRKTLLEQKLAQLETIEPLASPTSPESPTLPVQVSGIESPKRESLQYRRRSLNAKTSTNLTKEQSEIAEIASALESGRPLDANQLRVFEHVIRSEIKSLDEELHAKCTDPQHCYPRNLTVANFADWTCLPTVVYELEYPRQEHINWWYVAEKTAATFGVIWVMVVISQAYIYPSVTRAVQMQEAGLPLQERWNELPWILSDMLFPLLLEQLLAWYVIWECALNVLAELTRFADRGFYGDWWNSVSWDQYARDWNRPVHAFLLRHVYHSSISTFRLSKSTATFVTFLLSACVHELVMLCLFKKVRGYLFAMQLMQLPLAAMSRTKFLKGRNVLGNVVFWFGLFVGPSFITSLYLIV
ncbi:MBOAT, membrane-bound O-acyltransferase family-domain-containing protein [Lineolata rhizophorae]|uniref:O-acyltransferase n=1 Tax=Lineolata rhizophorae TaxID=578093 RepID=A0A6A6P0G8_9PEZI|nr:MBOAT, membrane-bound O-acyltransferase family-domain-containing protein [Lineolata rhizophorae]